MAQFLSLSTLGVCAQSARSITALCSEAVINLTDSLHSCFCLSYLLTSVPTCCCSTKMSAAQAFAYCQAVHDLRTCPVEVGSPQTQTQRLQVVRVIDFLIAQHAELLLQQQDLAMKAFHAQLQVQAQAEADAAALALTAATQASAANGGAAVTATATVVTSCTTSSSVIQAHIVPDLSAPTEETKGKTVPPSVIARGPHAIQSPIKPPSAVVRETTQEHISQMNKHTMGIYHGYGNPYNGQNQSLGRKKANTGQPPLTAPSPKSTSFPAIGTPKNLNGHAANGERHSRTSSPMDVAASGAVLTLATAIKDKTPLDGAALLQTLQAHPPRNPPPQNGRSEALGKHPGRGYSASHTAAGEIYVPHSSDEGENSDGDDEDEGFIISQMVSRGNMLASRTNSATLVTDDGAADLAAGGAGAILPSAAPVTRMVSADDSAELGSIEMDVATTATLDDTMALSPYIDTPGGNTLGYISSSSVSRCGSRPLSMAVDSPLIAPSSVHSSVTSAPNTSASMDVSNKLGSPISPITPGGPLAALPAVRSVSDGDRDNQGSDFDESVRPASGAPAAATRLAATEPAPHSAPEKTSRRLSGTKVITNAFRAGIKILTGGGGSSSGNSTPEGTTKPNKKAAAAAALKQPPPPEPTLKVCTAEEAGHANARPAPLKTASTDSWTSTTTTVTMSQSQSSTNTPTNASASLTQEPAAAVVSVKMS